MKSKLVFTLVGATVMVFLVGCGSGTMPEGPSASQIRAKIAEMPPEKQIEMYQSSPMPLAEKAAKVAEIKAKYGIK